MGGEGPAGLRWRCSRHMHGRPLDAPDRNRTQSSKQVFLHQAARLAAWRHRYTAACTFCRRRRRSSMSGPQAFTPPPSGSKSSRWGRATSGSRLSTADVFNDASPYNARSHFSVVVISRDAKRHNLLHALNESGSERAGGSHVSTWAPEECDCNGGLRVTHVCLHGVRSLRMCLS